MQKPKISTKTEEIVMSGVSLKPHKNIILFVLNSASVLKSKNAVCH